MFITYKNGKEYSLDYDEDAHSYKVDGVKVPSVTRIVDACFPKNLTDWAVSLGEEEYHRILDEALDIGNYTHEWIEKYITNNGKNSDPYNCSTDAFLIWEKNHNVEWIDS